MRYLHPCFMTLAFPEVAFLIVGARSSLVNRCAPSSHGSPSWVRNITAYYAVCSCEEAIAGLDYVVRARGACLLGYVSIQFFGSFFHSPFRCRYYFGYRFLEGLLSMEDQDRYLGLLYRSAHSRYRFSFLLAVCSCVVWFPLVDLLVVSASPAGFLLRGDLRRGGASLGSTFHETSPLEGRGRTVSEFLESASAFRFIFPTL